MSTNALQFALPIAELKPALAGLGKVVARRSTLPVLGTIKLERTTDDWIALTGTDLDHHVTVRLEQPAAGQPGALLVPYEDLLKTCRACGSGEQILVEPGDAHSATIKYRIGQHFVESKVESLPVEEFPELPRFKGEAIPLPDTLRQSIHEAMQCASSDATRLVLNGAYLDVSKPEGSYVIGTDGRCLYSSNSFSLPLKESLIIPTHKFIGWRREFNNDGEWQLKVAPMEKKDDPSYLQLSSRRWRFISRLIEGNYPNWRQVVPGAGQFTTTIEFNPEAIDAVIQTIGRMPCDDAIGLERSDGRLTLLGRSRGAEDWTRIAVEGVTSRGIDVRIFLNRNLLTKALQFGLTKVETIEPMSPLRFSQEGRQMIVMPTRTTTSPVSAAQDASPAPEPTERKSMPETNGTNTAGAKRAETTSEEPKPALESALAQLEVVRGDFRNAIAGVSKLGDLLKQVQRENRLSEKEISSVRATLRSLQSVRI